VDFTERKPMGVKFTIKLLNRIASFKSFIDVRDRDYSVELTTYKNVTVSFRPKSSATFTI